MGKLIKPDGTVETVQPANGRGFTKAELQGYVGERVQLILTLSGRVMVINNDGKRLNLAPNKRATEVAGIDPRMDVIAGNALIYDDGEVS